MTDLFEVERATLAAGHPVINPVLADRADIAMAIHDGSGCRGRHCNPHAEHSQLAEYLMERFNIMSRETDRG
jgi:hypothetical protein